MLEESQLLVVDLMSFEASDVPAGDRLMDFVWSCVEGADGRVQFDPMGPDIEEMSRCGHNGVSMGDACRIHGGGLLPDTVLLRV